MLHIPSALSYGIMSTGMVFANKFLLTNWGFEFPIIIICVEMAIHFIVISLLAKFKILKNIDYNIIKLINDDQRGKYLMLSVTFYILHSLSALKALSKMNIPIYVVFKRCVPIANLFISFFLFKNNPFTYKTNSYKIVSSIVLMTLGVIVAGFGDLKFDLDSYLYCGFSVVCQALYFSCVQKSGETQKNPFQLLIVCSSIATPILFVLSIISGQLKNLILMHDKFLDHITFYPSFLFVVSCGSLLCFSQFWCTINNNAITTSVIGVLKSSVQAFLGFLFFVNLNTVSFLTYFGIAMNLCFGTWYTYLMYIEKKTLANNHSHGNGLSLLQNNDDKFDGSKESV